MGRYEIIEQKNESTVTVMMKDNCCAAVAEIVPSIGFNVYRYTVSDFDVIGGPPDLETLHLRSSEFGIPVLFPPNRLKNGLMNFHNRTYQFPINEESHHLHGELRYKPWVIVDSGASPDSGAYVTAQFNFDHDILTYFPHPYRLTFTYRLKDGTLYLEGEVENLGTEEGPFCLGFHPYFSLMNEHCEDVEIIVPVESQYVLDEGGFPVDISVYSPICQELKNGIRLSDLPTDRDHTLFKLSQRRECYLIFHNLGLKIRYRFDKKFPFLALFKPPWMNAVSIEPYTCITDAFNLDLSEEITGAIGLQPGEIFTVMSEFSLQKI